MMPSTKAPRAGLVNWQNKRSNSPDKSTPPQGQGYKVATAMPAMSSITAAAAERYAQAGLSVIPTNQADHPTAPKKPVTQWKKYQTQIATGEERARMFHNGNAIAIVCGSVSGNLLTLDFDQQGKFGAFKQLLEGNDPELAARLTLHQRTPSGCDHLIIRCAGAVLGNQRLAMTADGKDILIETRGEGGYFLTEPSRGYHLTGDLCNPPTVTKEELEALFRLAAQFDQRPPKAETKAANSTEDINLAEQSRDQIKAMMTEELAAAQESQNKQSKNKKTDTNSDWRANVSSPKDLLTPFAVTDEYVSRLGKEEFLAPNLIIKGHVITIIAMPGGGKTTFFYYRVAPTLAKKGLTVWYIDADSPVSDHPRMKETADHHGFVFLNPDVNIGTGINELFESLNELAAGDFDLSGWVFFFDTLKKFSDLMSKQSIKEFYALCRKLTHKGATVVLLGHANKFRDKDGFLVFEGCGDVRSDSDELIYFERVGNPMGGIDVTTVVDHDRNAKVRGVFKPFSFHISESREITFYEKPLELTDPTATASAKATDEELLKVATTYLFEMGASVIQKQLVQHVADLTATGEKRVRQVIARNAEPKAKLTRQGLPLLFSPGEKNSLWYELPGDNSRMAGAE